MSEASSGAAPTGTQTLLRGLAIIHAVAGGACDLKSVGERVGTTRSTTHRLVSALVDERYLRLLPQGGYRLGARLIELGFQAREEVPWWCWPSHGWRAFRPTLETPFAWPCAMATRCCTCRRAPGRNGPEIARGWATACR
ncbi:helix-turn-helix domain-containing protein [Pseudomonas sp. KNUC1026]|uniref:helix-turn-helix domain-containing protein n=1 Tax=Pseudomonas sp. KNUC1026 TaxID=2893890 RepID=UPI003FA719F3